MEIEKVADRVLTCKKCRLHRSARRAVPGEGNPDAELVLVGEAPGEGEDEQGTPFVGRGGRKLDELLQSASIKREEVYITNIVKHRPPERRKPHVDEVEACFLHFEKEIDAVRPSTIVTLGNTATRELLLEERRQGLSDLSPELSSP